MAHDIFSIAGLPLPRGSHGARRRAAPASRTPLFAPKVIKKALGLAALDLPQERIEAAVGYARRCSSQGFLALNELNARQLFYSELLGKVLGYTMYDPHATFTLGFERNVRGRSVDVALGRFSDTAGDEFVAPLEMKGPGTSDLDAIMPGRGKSPVQQAWEYAIDAPGVQWVLVSNCLEIRLYRFGRGRDAYEHFDLRAIDQPSELERLVLVLEQSRFLSGATERLLADTDAALRDVTNELYGEYSALRTRLLAFLIDAGDGPHLPRLRAIEVAQKLLDRVLFVAFGGGTGLLPSRLLKDAADAQNKYHPVPIWTNFQQLFRAMNDGRPPPPDMFGYNGGLFAPDDEVDAIVLPDPLARDVAALGDWDYGSEVPVTVLGRLFEQSVTDIERLRAEAEGRAPPKVPKKKREGVVYTPDHVTRFIVEQTIGAALGERLAALLEKHTGARELPGPGDENSPWADTEAERAFWVEYLQALRALTVLDPACGSGAFLAAAFDTLAAEYHRVLEVLASLGDPIDLDPFDEILGRNLFGIDVNVESTEITRLSLWLKSARPRHRLATLDETIRDGDSLISDPSMTRNPFRWDHRFADIIGVGGFDIVIGNPPYVRMELIKQIKPYLAVHYAVASDRTDLYAYFFEKGISLLKPGGRLGFISSSTFFRTGSGERLRLLLSERTAIDTVVDFGDTQVFEGVTTYPAIVVARKLAPGEQADGTLRFLNVRDEGTASGLDKAFDSGSRTMPRSRLTGDSWRFEEEPVSRIRDKIAQGRKTLGEVYGAPLYGIKTGLNDAFIVDSDTRDRLVARDPKSAALLIPFLKGENIKRWRVEPEGLYLINIPKGRVRIDEYPSIRDHLLPFREELEARATKQEWYELQQAQLAYQPQFGHSKIIYPHFQNRRMFARDNSASFSNDKSYFIPTDDNFLLGFLNSTAFWFILCGEAPAVRNGWREMRVQYMERIPLPIRSGAPSLEIGNYAVRCLDATDSVNSILAATRARLQTDLGRGRQLSSKLRDWPALDFAAFLDEIRRAWGAEIHVRERGQWETYLAEEAEKVRGLAADIEASEREIDRLVCAAFDLTADEIGLVEQVVAAHEQRS